jgi:hypothetical protein
MCFELLPIMFFDCRALDKFHAPYVQLILNLETERLLF